MGKRKMWSIEEEKLIIKLASDGLNNKDIGIKVGRSKDSIAIKLSKLGYSRPPSPYYFSINEIVNNELKVVEQIRMSTGSKGATEKGYIVQSIIYPTSEQYTILESNLRLGVGCAYKRGLRIFEGNSLYSIKKIRGHLIDIPESKTIAPHHTAYKIKVKCNNCNKEKMMTPSHLVSHGFSCKYCRKGYYPENFFIAYTEVKELPFKHQQKLPDSNRIFDSVDYENKIICEQFGEQHYDKNSLWYKNSFEQDEDKRRYCKENGWTLIELDCRESSFEFIMNNINSNPLLPNIDDGDIEKILDLIKLNEKHLTVQFIDLYSYGFSSQKIADIYGTSKATVLGVLKRHNIKRRNGSIDLPELEICELYKNGMSIRQLADKYEVSTHPIVDTLKRHSINTRKR